MYDACAEPHLDSPTRRQVLTDAALEVLAEHGARGFTHREVDRRLGLPLGSASNYFRRRDDMFVAVAERVLQLDGIDMLSLEQRIAQWPEISVDKTADAFAALFADWFHLDRRDRLIARMEVLFESFRNPQVRSVRDRAINAGLSFYKVIFARLCAKDPAASAELFGELVNGLNVLIVSGSTSVDRTTLRALLSGYLDICLTRNAENDG